MRINNLSKKYIFWDCVWSCFPEVDSDLLVKEAYSLKDSSEGIIVSNRNGWHSEIQEEGSQVGELSSLEMCVRTFCEAIAAEEGFGVSIKDLYWWVNINGNGGYNRPHNHPKTELSAVFYAKTPENCGELTLARTDSSTYGYLYNKIENGREILITPRKGELHVFPGHLWHWVEPNLSGEDRISITFNVECR